MQVSPYKARSVCFITSIRLTGERSSVNRNGLKKGIGLKMPAAQSLSWRWGVSKLAQVEQKLSNKWA
jgi:hypothetical protein